MIHQLKIGAYAELSLIVGEEHTAACWGSGDLRVFATPRMIALMEGAAVAAVEPHLPAGYQTVGTALEIRHVAATPVGERIWARAELIEVDGRKLVYRVEARDNIGTIGEGIHRRFIVHAERFMQRTQARMIGA